MEASPEAELRAARRRQNVADQLYAALIESAYTGSRDVLALRLRSVMEAERRADLLALRGALMDLAVTSAGWVADLDERLPPDPGTGRRRRGAA